MSSHARRVFAVVLSLATTVVASAILRAAAADEPETVMITLRARSGAEEAMAHVIARHWDTARELKLIDERAPHVTLRAADEPGKTYFVEIFSWRDASIPDAAPPAIQAIWRDMNRLAEARGGRPPLDIVVMTPVAAPRP